MLQSNMDINDVNEVDVTGEMTSYDDVQFVDPRNDITIYKESETENKKFRKLTPIEKKKIKKRKEEDTHIDKTHEGFLHNDNDLQKETTFNLVQPPKGLKTRLMDYQLYGISWMISREDSHIKGGILADQMGMGKTLQTIGLMLARKEFEKKLDNCSNNCVEPMG